MDFSSLQEKLAFSHLKYNVIKEMEDLFVKQGYLYLDSNPFEDYEDYLRRGGELKESYLKVVLPSGDVKLLSADLTSGLVEEIRDSGATSPVKVFYNGEVYRNVDQQVKILTKVGIECFGINSLETDGELLAMAASILGSYSQEYLLEIGVSPIIFYLLELLELPKEDHKIALEYIRKKDKNHLADFLGEKAKWNAGKTLLSIFSMKGTWNTVEKESHLLREDEKLAQWFEELKNLNDFLEQQGKISLRYDFSQVPDFNYYSSFSFRGYISDCNEELIKGGRYLLTDVDGKEVSGVGFSVEVTPLMDYLGGKNDITYSNS